MAPRRGAKARFGDLFGAWWCSRQHCHQAEPRAQQPTHKDSNCFGEDRAWTKVRLRRLWRLGKTIRGSSASNRQVVYALGSFVSHPSHVSRSSVFKYCRYPHNIGCRVFDGCLLYATERLRFLDPAWTGRLRTTVDTVSSTVPLLTMFHCTPPHSTTTTSPLLHMHQDLPRPLIQSGLGH
jgi:hypothetical protein